MRAVRRHRGRDSSLASLRSLKATTKQFCPLPRSSLKSKLESRESSPCDPACPLWPQVDGSKKERQTPKCGACESTLQHRQPGKKVAPTTTFVP